jgi:indolepyruvate ferredoxin oxidoreductase
MTTQILNGNELLIQGGLEAGFKLYTGYPGSPLADFFNILYDKKEELKKDGIHVVLANSEANAAAMASGAKMAGQDCLVAMKSMGLHVAADALSVGNFANPGKEYKDPETGETLRAGVVVAVGDDPWSISTSTPADSRYLYKHLHIPFLEPSTPQELKDWMKKALELSKRTSVYQGVLLTTFMAEGGGRVECYEKAKVQKEAQTLDSSEFDLQKHVMVPPNSLIADHTMIKERFPQVEKTLSQMLLDKLFGKEESKIGVISSGAVFETLKQFFDDHDYLEEFSLYKLASSYPLTKDQLLPFLKGLETLIVVEEKRGFLETEIKEFCQENGVDLKIFGKQFDKEEGFPAYGGISYEILQDKFSKIFENLKISTNYSCKSLKETTELSAALPKRLPTFCPGCPHRETLSLLKDLRKSLDKENINLISHGDVGCYSLSFLEPFKEMHDLSAMGQGGALAAGTDLFTTNPSVVLMGDSTFFHSGISAISNSVQCDHNITYILLDNDNTAMTGHQMTPRTGISVEGRKRPRQDMLRTVQSLGVKDAIEVNPSDRYFYKSLLADYVGRVGTKVIISNKECGLTFHSKEKRKERKAFNLGEVQKVKRFYQINTDACEDCRECITSTGCPGLSQTVDAYGPKVVIDHQICVNDSYCTKIKACPSFELVEVANYHPTKYKKEEIAKAGPQKLPLPSFKIGLESIAKGLDYRVVVIGVGGSGVTTISRVIAEAAKTMGGRGDLDFKFVDQKGLAQRNGSVTSHLSIFKKGKSHGQTNPEGSCQLVISPDLLEGARAVKYLREDGSLYLDSHFQIPLSILLDKYGPTGPEREDLILSSLKEKFGEKVFNSSFKELSYKKFGKSVYASAMILGTLFQKGELPFSLEDLRDAFRSSVPQSELQNNLSAFHVGREMALGNRAKNEGGQSKESLCLLEKSLEESVHFFESKEKILGSYKEGLDGLMASFSDISENLLKQYIHDIFIFDRGRNIDSFMTDAKLVATLYNTKQEREVALRTLAKTYWIKDEVFVSHQMISPMKRLKDLDKYKNLGQQFRVVHINRPAFIVFGRKIEFDFSPRPWMLRLMRHMRFLRLLMPAWHSIERKIAQLSREEILKGVTLERLRQIEGIKGYREVRYEEASNIFGKEAIGIISENN